MERNDSATRRVEEAHRASSVQIRPAELCRYSGAHRSALRGWRLEVPKAVEIMIRLMPEARCEHPEDLLSRVRPRVKGR